MNVPSALKEKRKFKEKEESRKKGGKAMEAVCRGANIRKSSECRNAYAAYYMHSYNKKKQYSTVSVPSKYKA